MKEQIWTRSFLYATGYAILEMQTIIFALARLAERREIGFFNFPPLVGEDLEESLASICHLYGPILPIPEASACLEG